MQAGPTCTASGQMGTMTVSWTPATTARLIPTLTRQIPTVMVLEMSATLVLMPSEMSIVAEPSHWVTCFLCSIMSFKNRADPSLIPAVLLTRQISTVYSTSTSGIAFGCQTSSSFFLEVLGIGLVHTFTRNTSLLWI